MQVYRGTDLISVKIDYAGVSGWFSGYLEVYSTAINSLDQAT